MCVCSSPRRPGTSAPSRAQEQKRTLAHISLPLLYNPYVNGLRPASHAPRAAPSAASFQSAARCTGLEDSSELNLEVGTIIAQRYRVVASIGKGSFSRVVQCLDLHEKMMVSVKVLRNDKDCMDQGLGEVRLLALIGQHDARGEQPLLSMLDYFYYKDFDTFCR